MGGKPRLGSLRVMNHSSMIVFQIDVDGIAFDPAERHAPVPADVDRIAALVAANESMKAKPSYQLKSQFAPHNPRGALEGVDPGAPLLRVKHALHSPPTPPHQF